MRIALIAASALLFGASTAQAQQVPQPERAARPEAALVGHGPNGATLRCRDGSYPAPGAADSACEGKGGVLARFPLIRRPAAARVDAPALDPRVAVPDTTLPEEAMTYEAMRRQIDAATARGGQPPAGATLLCVNGSYVVADTSSARCAQAGGVRLRFEVPRRP